MVHCLNGAFWKLILIFKKLFIEKQDDNIINDSMKQNKKDHQNLYWDNISNNFIVINLLPTIKIELLMTHIRIKHITI